MKFFATTVKGLEDIAAREVRNLLNCNVKLGFGKIFFESDSEAIFKLNMLSRTIHKVSLLLCHRNFSTLKDIYDIAKNIDYTEFIASDQSFAIRAERVGVHDFTSMDVAATVGQAVIDSYMESKNIRLKVNLDEPDVEILCLVKENEFLMGLNTTGESLHRRGYRIYDHPAALKTTIASSMVLMADWNPKKLLLDPFCGGGTILIEAAQIARNIPPGLFRWENFAFKKLKFLDYNEFEDLRLKCMCNIIDNIYPIWGLEKFSKHLNGALINALSGGVLDTLNLICGDATKLEEYLSFTPELIITNPPYGVRMKPRRIRILYSRFLKSLKRIASGSKLIIITAARRKFSEAAEEVGIEIISKRIVFHGNLETAIFNCIIP